MYTLMLTGIECKTTSTGVNSKAVDVLTKIAGATVAVVGAVATAGTAGAAGPLAFAAAGAAIGFTPELVNLIQESRDDPDNVFLSASEASTHFQTPNKLWPVGTHQNMKKGDKIALSETFVFSGGEVKLTLWERDRAGKFLDSDDDSLGSFTVSEEDIGKVKYATVSNPNEGSLYVITYMVTESIYSDIQNNPIRVLLPTKSTVKGFDEIYVSNKLAVEFSENDVPLSEWAQSLDDDIALASFFALKEIVTKEAFTDFDKCIQVLNNSDQLVQIEGTYKAEAREWRKSSEANWKIDGSPNSEDVKVLEKWFKDYVDSVDPSIYKNSVIVKNGIVTRLAKIANETGARVENFDEIFYDADEKREKVLELSIIRFPSNDQPHIQLFKLVVEASFYSKRITFHECNESGFSFDLKTVKFSFNSALKGATSVENLNKVRKKLADPESYLLVRK